MIRIAIASRKGGTGKTFVATNIFYTLLKNQIDAVLVDCDAEAPNAAAFFETRQTNTTKVTQLVPEINTNTCIFCRKCHEYCNYNAIFILPPMNIIQVVEDLCHGCGACSVACEYEAITEKSILLGKVSTFSINGHQELVEARMNVGIMSPVPIIKSAIKLASHNSGIVIFDSPPGTSCPFIQTVSASDYVILITEPTPFGLSDLKQSVDTLNKINKPCGVIINRSDLGNSNVKNYLLQQNIPLLSEIPFSKEIAELYSMGKIVVETIPNLGVELYNLVKKLTDQYGNSSN
jgi:MinD superfamily P-loop ATPase